MLRRNRADTLLEIGLTATSRIKFLHARSWHSASGASRADLICWTHFCSFHFSAASATLRSVWITFFLLHEIPQCTHFCSFLMAGSQRNSGGCFFQCGPSFPRSFSAPRHHLTPPGADSSLRAQRARSHSSMRWTHFYSPRLIDEGPALHAFDFTRRLTGLRDIGIQEARQKGGFVFRPVRPTS